MPTWTHAHTRMHTRSYTHVHIDTHARTSTTHIRPRTHTCTRTHAHIHVHRYILTDTPHAHVSKTYHTYIYIDGNVQQKAIRTREDLKLIYSFYDIFPCLISFFFFFTALIPGEVAHSNTASNLICPISFTTYHTSCRVKLGCFTVACSCYHQPHIGCGP